MHAEGRSCLSTAILAVCLIAQFCFAQGAAPADLKALRARYEQGLASIHTNSVKALQDWPNAYTADLKKLEKKLQSSGDLDGLLAVRKEMERFGEDKAIPERALSESPALKEAQLKWRKTPETIEIDQSRRIVLLARSYSASLEELKRKLTTQGKVEQAIEAKDESERVRTSAPVTAAQFALASAGVDLRPDGGRKGKPPAPLPEPEGDDKPSSLAANLRGSLVLHYSFDRNEGKKVTDRSGKGNDGKVFGTRWASKGKVGGACFFNGVDDVIDIGANTLDTLKDATLSVWINSPKPVANDFILFEYYANDGSRLDLRVDANGAGLSLVNRGAQIGVHTKTFAFGDWVHVAVVMGSRGMSLYYNGRLASDNDSYTDTFARLGKPVHSTIGRTYYSASHVGGGCYFQGGLDEFMVFDRALSADEVKRIYDSQK
jgi:hypothetical protein